MTFYSKTTVVAVLWITATLGCQSSDECGEAGVDPNFDGGVCLSDVAPPADASDPSDMNSEFEIDPDDGIPPPDQGVIEPDLGSSSPCLNVDCGDARCVVEAGMAECHCSEGQILRENACLTPELHVQLGTEIIAVEQSIPLEAVLRIDGESQMVDPDDLDWQFGSDLIEIVDGAVHGLSLGGGDRYRPDGSVWIQAVWQGVESPEYPLQVIKLREGVGLYPAGDSIGSDEPEAGAPPPAGNDRYDGLYPFRPDEQKFYCQADADCAQGTCDTWQHACVDERGVRNHTIQDCDWNEEVCVVHKADVRLGIGSTISLSVRATAQYAEFGIGELVEEPPEDDPTNLVPRPLRLDWLVPAAYPQDIVRVHPLSGEVEGLRPGRTLVRGLIGLQGLDFEVVVDGAFGVNPADDYSQGAQPEEGYLVMFSSSHGPAALGTHDTMRAMDLNTFTELDFRPSKYGPQGRRLRENGEQYEGGGCGMVQGENGEVFLLNGQHATVFDTHQMQQARGNHQIRFRPLNAPSGARDVCNAVYWRSGNSEYLIGFELNPNEPVRVYIAQLDDLEQGDILAEPVMGGPFNNGPPRTGYNPLVWTDAEQGQWLVFVEQDDENQIHFVPLLPNGELGFDAMDTILAPGTDDVVGRMEAPGLIYAAGHIFVGGERSISVIDPEEREITQTLDTAFYGNAIKDFALSPDGDSLYALPYTTYPQNPLRCEDVSDCPEGDAWSCEGAVCRFDGQRILPGQIHVDFEEADGSTRRVELSNQRVAILDLTGDTIQYDKTRWDCFVEDEALCESEPYRRYGVDLRYIAFKKHILDTLQSNSAGAIPAVLALNARDMVVTENSLVLIGADANNGAGSAIANLSDLAIYNISPNEGPAYGVVFRGYRGLPRTLQGLSDPFGFRLGAADEVLAGFRVKNAGIMYIPGPPPPDSAGDGPPHRVDAPVEKNNEYANAPALPDDDQGTLLLLSSSHGEPNDGVMDVMRSLDLSTWTEDDHDPMTAGAQGTELREDDDLFNLGCGMTWGPDGEVWIFSEVTAIAFDPRTGEQLYDGHAVHFPGRQPHFCSGVIHREGDQHTLYAFDSNIDARDAPMVVADLTGLTEGSVNATAIEDPYLDTYRLPDGLHAPRYTNGLIHAGELYFIEKNEPRSAYHNVVHRAQIEPNWTLRFDPERDLEGSYTDPDALFFGDPALTIAEVGGIPHLFIGNQYDITIYQMANPDAPQRLNYNADGDGLQDDLSTFAYGRSITAFTTSPDGSKLFALPYAKSSRHPIDRLPYPRPGGTTAYTTVDRFRMVALDLETLDDGRPMPDTTINNGNGIDLVFSYLKSHILAEGYSSGILPPIFLTVRPQIAASERSVFVIGLDAADGAGTSLGPIGDLAAYDIKTGRGYIFRGWEFEGMHNASGPFGFPLGMNGDEADTNLAGRRVKNGAVLYLP